MHAESFWRCDGCEQTWGLTPQVRRVTGGLAGVFGDPEEWETTDLEVAVTDEPPEDDYLVIGGMIARPAEDGRHTFVLPPPCCGSCGETMRRVVSLEDARDWAEQFPVT